MATGSLFRKGNKNLNFKHGLKLHPLYSVWVSMRQRCNNKNRTEDYPRYGGRGITYDKRWDSFVNFYKDMLPLWKKGFTLDRIDVNGNYTKSNCRFVDRVIQANNRRNLRLFDFDGKSLTLTNWAKFLGVNRSTLAQRFYCLHWSVEKTLTV